MRVGLAVRTVKRHVGIAIALRGSEGCLVGSVPFFSSLLVWMVFNCKQVCMLGMSMVDPHCNPINLQPSEGGQNDDTRAFPARLWHPLAMSLD